MISQLKKHVHNAFDQAGDLAEVVTLKHKTGEEFDPSTGENVITYSEHQVKIIKMDYTTTEIAQSNNVITSGDRKVLLPVNEVDFRPVASDDKFIIDGSENSIKAVREKSKSLYIIRI